MLAQDPTKETPKAPIKDIIVVTGAYEPIPLEESERASARRSPVEQAGPSESPQQATDGAG